MADPIVLAQSAPPVQPGSPASAAPSRADQIRELVSYGAFDWSVSRDDQARVLDLLRNDPDLNTTIGALAADANFVGTSSLTTMLKRVDIPEFRRDVIDVLARGANDTNAQAIRRELNGTDIQSVSGLGGAGGTAVNDQVWQVRFNLVRLGVPPTGPSFDRSPYAGLVSSDPTAPFTGAGATGVNPTDVSVPLGDQWRMLTGDAATTRRYHNPVGDLNGYLASLPPGARTQQAELFLNQPISTPMRDVWGDAPPTRAQVIEVAARQHNLDPKLVAAFLLAEQRDQSRNEDGKDIAAALNAGHNSSIGLGQVVISTARDNNLLGDSVSPELSRTAGPYAMTRLLSDDAANIFAAARYIRQVADRGSTIPLATLEARTLAAQQQEAIANGLPPPTAATYTRVATMYPGFDPAAYAGHSSHWPAANIAALGSEYTSRAWDGRWSAWGGFVGEAYNDVRASGVFR